jgi:hypothetical protein
VGEPPNPLLPRTPFLGARRVSQAAALCKGELFGFPTESPFSNPQICKDLCRIALKGVRAD